MIPHFQCQYTCTCVYILPVTSSRDLLSYWSLVLLGGGGCCCYFGSTPASHSALSLSAPWHPYKQRNKASNKQDIVSLYSYRGVYEEYWLLRCTAVYSGRCLPIFQKNVLPPFWGWKNRSRTERNYTDTWKQKARIGAQHEPTGIQFKPFYEP